MKLGPIVAERSLRTAGAGRAVKLRLGMPRPLPKSDWECPYQIVGLGKSQPKVAYGLDGLQALLMAVEALRVRIEKSAKRLTWEGGEDGDNGLPRVIPTFFGLSFAEKLSELIDREVERFSRRQEKTREPRRAVGRRAR